MVRALMQQSYRRILDSIYSEAVPVYSRSTFFSSPSIASTATAVDSIDIRNSNKESDYNCGNPRQLVVILGWGGAKKRQLEKIRRFYNDEMGVDTIVQVMSFPAPSFVHAHFEDSICELIDKHYASCLVAPCIEKEVHTTTRTLRHPMLHVFSNNGSWSYASLCQRSDFPRPKAVIFDSAPHFIFNRADVLTQKDDLTRVVVSIILQRAQYHHAVLTPLLTPVISVLLYLSEFVLRVQGSYRIVPDLVSYSLFLRDESPIVPSLFIYSSGDRLCNQSKIEEFIAARRSRGVPCRAEKFGTDVEHICGHFKYADVYKGIVKSFLQSIVSSKIL